MGRWPYYTINFETKHYPTYHIHEVFVVQTTPAPPAVAQDRPLTSPPCQSSVSPLTQNIQIYCISLDIYG